MKKLTTLLLAVLMMLSTFAFGCGNGFVMEEGVHYSQEFLSDDPEADVYNKDVFYRNDIVQSTADPFAFRCEDETDEENYGTYFLWGTTGLGVFNCYFSKDLVSWEPKNGAYEWTSESWQGKDCWAPEVIWDPYANETDYGLEDNPNTTGVYFIFCSATPWWSTSIAKNAANGMQLDLGISTCPYGPYVQWQGVEQGTVIAGVDYGREENYAKHTLYEDAYNEGTYEGYVGRKGNKVDIDDSWWNSPAATASLDLQWHNREYAGSENPDGYYINEAAKYMIIDEGDSWFTCIDPTPYLDYNQMVTKIDDEGNTYQEPKKYMFFTRDQSVLNGKYGEDYETNILAFKGTCVYAVEFVNNDWTQIDYNSLRRITRTNANFVSQKAADEYVEQAKAFDASKYSLGVQEISANETAEEYNADGRYNLAVGEAELRIMGGSNGINEGAQMWYNKDTGLYYLTLSIAAYTNNTYSVIQCVAYDIMGPYRKLTLAEGGLLLTTDNGRAMDNVTGPGHHTMYQCGDELLMFYHKHKDLNNSIYERGFCMDRVSWVQNPDGMTVMYVNGPTTMIQPLIYGTGATDYDIISDEAKISVKGKDDNYNDVKYLNDGIIPIHEEEITPFVHEFIYEGEKLVITLEWEDYRQVKAIMIFNSKEYEMTFEEIESIVMDAKIDGKKGKVSIEHLQFYWDRVFFETGDDVRPGGAATAVFDEMAIKKIKITILNPNMNITDTLGIPEIYVVGRPIA